MGYKAYFNAVPIMDKNVRMMAFAFGQPADLIGKAESGLKILEFEILAYPSFVVRKLPARNLAHEILELAAFQRLDASFARHAFQPG